MDDTESYIDDRCPTVWGPPSARPRDVPYEVTPHRQEQPAHQDVPRSLPAGLSGVPPRDDRRVKPIDGALLRKLFQATMEGKRRVAMRERAAQQAVEQVAGGSTKPAEEETPLKELCVPRSSSHGAKCSDRKEQLQGEQPPDEIGKEKKADKKTKAEKKGKKKAPVATTPAPTDPPASILLRQEDVTAVEDEYGKPSSEAQPEPEKQKAARKEKSKGQGNPRSSQGQEQPTNKLSKKEKKKQKQAENAKAKAGTEAVEALMSGGLLAENNETSSNRDDEAHPDDFIEVGEVQNRSWGQKVPEARSSSRAGTVHLQPTVESVTSSRSSKRGKISSKPQSTRSAQHYEPLPTVEPWSTEIDKPVSFISWEEVGQGVVGEVARVASRIASSKHSSKARSGNVFEGFDQACGGPEDEELVSRHRFSLTEKRHDYGRSSMGHRSEARYSKDSRYSRTLHHSRTPVGSSEYQDQPWQEEEPVNTRSKASSRRTTAPTVETVAKDMDPWAQGGLDEVPSRQSSSKHGSRVRSQLTFEEIGECWAEARPEIRRSENPAVSVHSKPFSFHETPVAGQAWSQQSTERNGIPRQTEQRSTASTFEEIGKRWQDPDGVEGVARSRQTSLRSREESSHAWNAHEQRQNEPAPPQSQQESENANRTRAEIKEHTPAVRSTESAAYTRSTNDYERHLQEVRPTVFAGKGWISPHPLSRSPTEMASPPQSKIILPSQAYPHGATMTYEQWKAVQEEGMRRNISPTESHLKINARRAQSRHRYAAAWGAYSSDGHRFEGVTPDSEAEASVSGPASYRVPSMDSERSSGGMLSDERPPTQRDTYIHDLAHKSTWGGTWEEQHPSERSEQSRRHSRVQTLYEWSHEHSGSKQAHYGSGLTGEDGSRRSSRLSSRHDSTHSLHHSSRQSSSQSGSHRSSRHSSHRRSHRSVKRSDSAQSPSIGWGRFSLGTARSPQIKQNQSNRSSRRTDQRSLSDRRKTASDNSKASSHDAGESGRYTRHSEGHSSQRKSRHSDDRSASAHSEARAADSTQSPHGSTNSRHKSSHHGSKHHSRHTFHRTRSIRSESHHSADPSAASMSSSERMQEVMEEGRNVWSDIPQYEGTVSDREQYIERSDISAIPTSQLYWKRYRGVEAESGVERWE